MSDESLVQLLVDQLGDDEVTARKMFGGHGVYLGGRMFALVYDGAVYMKVSDDEAATSERPPFRPRANQTFPTFREVPADALEDQAALQELARAAQEAAGS